MARKLLYENKICQKLFCYITHSASKFPRICGKLKIDKPKVLLRTVVDFRFSQLQLAVYLNSILQSKAKKIKYIVKNSEAFKNRIKKTTINSDYCMASLDVNTLFTKIPTQRTLAIMKSKLVKNTSWKEKTELDLQDIV